MAVAPEGGTDSVAGGVGPGHVLPHLLFQLRQVARDLAGERLDHDGLGDLADARQVPQPSLFAPSGQLLGLEGAEGGCCSPKGAYPVGGGTRPFEQVGDPLEGGQGVHRRGAYR